MTSPWSDGIASDLEPGVSRDARKSDSVAPEFQARMGDWDTEPREPNDLYWAACDCADCRAIVALVEEETINKP